MQSSMKRAAPAEDSGLLALWDAYLRVAWLTRDAEACWQTAHEAANSEVPVPEDLRVKAPNGDWMCKPAHAILNNFSVDVAMMEAKGIQRDDAVDVVLDRVRRADQHAKDLEAAYQRHGYHAASIEADRLQEERMEALSRIDDAPAATPVDIQVKLMSFCSFCAGFFAFDGCLDYSIDPSVLVRFVDDMEVVTGLRLRRDSKEQWEAEKGGAV